MRAPCVAYPEREPLILIRRSQVILCDGNHCAAALLSFFGFWHSIKLENREQAMQKNRVARMHGEAGTQDTSLLVFKTEAEIEEGLLGLYGRKTIRAALDLLVAKGFVTIHTNPTARYRFDHTRYFLFHPETVAAQLLARADEVKIPDRETKEDENFVSSNSLQPVEISDEVKIPDRESKNASSSGKNASTIPEITPEITPESLGERARAHEAEHLKAFEQRFSPAPSYTCPEEFVPSPAIRDWATRVYPAVDFEAALAAMRVWESPRPVRNWNLKLKSFVQKEPTFRARSPGGNHHHTSQDALSARRTREQNVEQRFLETYHARSRGPAGLSGGDETVIDDVQYRTDR